MRNPTVRSSRFQLPGLHCAVLGLAAALAADLVGCNPTPAPGPRAAVQPDAPAAPIPAKLEAPKTPPVVPAPTGGAPNEAAPKKADGKLVVDIDGNQYRSPNGADLPGPWLYVDERLVHSYAEEFGRGYRFTENLSLPPGKHTVEVDSTTYARDFPLTFQRQVVQINSSQDTTVTFTLLKAEDEYSFSGKASDIITGGNANYSRAYQHYAGKFSTQMTLYQTDPVVRALLSAKANPIIKHVVVVDLPESRGGRRELDARQVRLIVAWLHYSYLNGWFPALITRSVDDFRLGPDLDELDRKVDLLKGLVKQKNDEIEEFNAIARKLDEAPE